MSTHAGSTGGLGRGGRNAIAADKGGLASRGHRLRIARGRDAPKRTAAAAAADGRAAKRRRGERRGSGRHQRRARAGHGHERRQTAEG